MQRGQAQGVAGAITTNQLTVVFAEKRWLQNKHTISTHNSCGKIDNDSQITQRPISKGPLPIAAMKKKNYKLNANNHSTTGQIAQAEAIKFTTNQSESRTITRAAPKAHDKNDQLRSNTLREINAWCYRRASHLSLTGHDQAAQALTEEHMEALQNAKPEETLWVEN